MSKPNSTIKATRATIELGDIELDVFQLPDGSYVASSAGLASLIGGSEKQYRPNFFPDGLKALLPKDFNTVQNITKISTSSKGNKINAIPLAIVSYIAMYHAMKGNAIAQAILQASLSEALERRADTAFGIQRSEEERNLRLAERINHAKQYHPAYTAWIQRDGAIHGWEYGQAMNALKTASGLPVKPIDQYSYQELTNINRAEVAYDTARQLGADHSHALDLVANQSRKLGLVI